MKTTKNSNHSGSNSVNKHYMFTKTSQISSNTSSSKRVNDQIKEKNSNKNVLEMIYDDEFVIMINQLSTSIKNYYRANNKNFSTVKSIFNNNEMNDNNVNALLLETFNKIENNFSFFYSSAKQIFKNMKIYRREKIANILAQTKKKTVNHRNNNNPINYNTKQKYSDAKLNQLLKSPNESSTKNVFKENNKAKAFSINLMSDDKNRSNKEKNENELFFDNNENENNRKNNYNEYFDVINTYSKKQTMKNSSKIKDYKSNEDNNNTSLLNSVKGEDNSRNRRIFISSLNKSDKNPSNKKFSIFGINANNNKRVKSSDKNIKKSFESKKIRETGQINKNFLNQDNFESPEDMSDLIKEKEELIINLKSSNIHFENKIKELENTNNTLNEKVKEIENNLKKKRKNI